ATRPPLPADAPGTAPAHADLPWAGEAYSIKRHGTSLTLCETEPVRTPGCIQAHGALLVTRLLDFEILQVSENTADYFDRSPSSLLGQPLSSLLSQDQLAQLRSMMNTDTLEGNALYAFTLPALGGAQPLDVCVHTMGGVMVLEFEVTLRATQPQADFFSLVRASVGRLQTTVGLRPFCQQLALEVRNITGLDRVMVYRFHADYHGEVFAESKLESMAPWLGLHYPEADIPKPARDLYKRLWIRPVPNAAGPLVEMTPLANPDTAQPLDMTFCSLRGASVMYTEYLTNMGVAASLTMPILIEGKLWGMVSCHHNTPTHFAHQARAACELLAQVASLQLKSTEHIERLDYQLKVESVHQQMVTKAAQEGDLLALSDRQPSLLDAMQADGAALHHSGRWWCAGLTPDDEHLDALADWLGERSELESLTRPVFVTEALQKDWPACPIPPEVVSGMIAVRISRQPRGLIMWFRPQTIQTIHWAGNPQDKPLVPGPNGMRLTPRRSFELFVESVKGRSLPWLDMEVDSALRLRMLVMELVIASADRLSAINVDLSNSNEELDAFAYVASHDLKEPLRGIHHYAHQIIESAQMLVPENRERLASLVRLTLRMDTLLDSLLNFSRVGRTHLEFEQVDLNEVVAEALEMVGVRPGDNSCTISFPRPLPHALCDLVRVREIYSNLISNALKYTRRDKPHIEIGYAMPSEPGPRPNAPLVALSHTIYYVRDDGIGMEASHFEHIFKMFKRLHGRDAYGGGVGAGLSVVKKVVSRHAGRVWVDSTPGAGSTFYFTLPCTSDKQNGLTTQKARV
ncbi:MAG: GAF domain-containing protein, partial [Chitinophagaceae bacterium]|nr:GAF domain-containing protein [Polaromonas sp.]